ncbi:hypothetical protein Poli38472_009661 [Pythium oligandrum]|uniref:Cytoplasmic dynein 2 light intermediate chain 1 n=1 Tax=Pythium oligandrum TaxID=41045 RepID=A0A8K1CGN1_PYTOL|nr:hypothetical protein Poli38472_009661 [Pythium oligandrum]|eukprot:TMW62168.1 hypothetical protein Poli38472_009661 [Pythium oligandrum]
MKPSAVAKGASSGSSTKDIWLALSSMEPLPSAAKENQTQDVEAAKSSGGQEERDTFTLIVGSKNAGKTTLTATFRNSSKTEEIKPTTALEYVFVRLKATSGRAPVAHMWELASSKCIPEMMRVPLAPERILNSALIIVLDLSVPGDVVSYLIKWLVTLYRVVHDVLKAKEKNPVDKLAVDRLRQEAMARYGPSHPDRDEVTPMPVPLWILCNKYDVFRDEDSVKRKGVTQALRSLAHQYGATLLFSSTKDKNLVTQFRSVMKSFAFRALSGLKGAKDVDAARAVFVPAGADLFEDIGFPKTARKHDFSRDQHEEKARQWIKIVSEYYPPSGEVQDADLTGNSSVESEIDAKDAEDGKEAFPELNIDRIRQRKREELRRYREHRKKVLEKAKTSASKA